MSQEFQPRTAQEGKRVMKIIERDLGANSVEFGLGEGLYASYRRDTKTGEVKYLGLGKEEGGSESIHQIAARALPRDYREQTDIAAERYFAKHHAPERQAAE